MDLLRSAALTRLGECAHTVTVPGTQVRHGAQRRIHHVGLRGRMSEAEDVTEFVQVEMG